MTYLSKKFATACLATAIAGTGITLVELSAHAEPARPAVVAKSERSAPAARDVDADASRYAARERTADKQRDYRGGKMLTIGISATALIVIIVLLIVLL